MRDNDFFFPSIIIGLAFVLGVGIFTWFWSDARSADQTISVTGSAKKDIVSDIGILRGSISVEAYTAETAYRSLTTQKPILLEYLKSQGFPSDQVKFFTVTNYPVYNYSSDGQQTTIRGHVYSQRMEIVSNDVKKIEKLSLDIASVIEKGVFFNVEPPEYHFSKLAGMKIQVQAEAAKDAQQRAKKIADATGRSLGPLRSARMGVLQITPKLSVEISDYGMNDVSSIEKQITAVVNANFQIR